MEGYYVELRVRSDLSDINGHTFIFINGKGYGFYPGSSVLWSYGEIVDDTDTPYTHSLKISLSKEQYETLESNLKDMAQQYAERSLFPPYSVLEEQCASWAIARLSEAGVRVPELTDYDIYRDPHDQAGIIEELPVNNPALMPYTHKPAPLLEEWLIKLRNDTGNWLKELFDDAQAYWRQVFFRDPLALDLDGDGLETTGFSLQNPIWFDHDLNGSAEGTGWLKGDDGFLVLDRNGNGTIDDGSELFGDHPPLTGGGYAANGFAALVQEDTNGDGIVNASYANWANLRVWRDINQDGISQSNELFDLNELGIQGINTGTTGTGGAQGNGNQMSN